MGTSRDARTSTSTRNDVGNGGRILTEKVLEAARKGSTVELKLISNTFESSIHFISVQAVEAILCNLKADAVPKLEQQNLSSNLNRYSDPKFRRQFVALTGVATIQSQPDGINVRGLQPLLRNSWPDVFPWIQFFFHPPSDTKLPGARGFEEAISRLLLGALNTFLAVQEQSTSRFVSQTPGAARIAIQLWIREGLSVDPAKSAQPDSLARTSSLVVLLALGDEPTIKILDEVVEGAGAEGDQFSKRLPVILQKYMKFAFDAGGELAQVPEVVSILVKLTTSHHSHPLPKAFLSQGMVPFIVKYIASLAAKLFSEGYPKAASPLNSIFLHCFQYICYTFYATDGVQNASQAIDAGLLEAFIAWSPTLPFLSAKEQDHILDLFSDSIMPLLVYLPVLFASISAIDRVEAQNTSQGLFQKGTRDAKNRWSTLVEIVKKRDKLSLALAALTLHDVLHPRDERKLVCDNCYKPNKISAYKTCAGCKYVCYCSKACQIQGWKEGGHREQCKLLRGQGDVLSNKELVGRPGKSASPRQVDTFIRNLAHLEALENIGALRTMARKQLPHVHIEDVGIEVDFRQFPVVFNVFARTECIRAREAHERGVVEESNANFSPFSREYHGEKMRRSTRDVVQFDIGIRRGRQRYRCSHGVNKFWELSDQDVLKFNTHLDDFKKLESLLDAL
ncbi:hypothetical protein SCHPADRAFT_928296 [Schizopora paradoxa]|uniref:MYND-type domain-containing protein n=1 Tax=Schizopora paradoxa TaxID=27342 RepID=A0A0H2RWD5_9AGAM|nr:hypothetical protein SCHPADRAFT_928296 [Schizopora paradoxa]